MDEVTREMRSYDDEPDYDSDEVGDDGLTDLERAIEQADAETFGCWVHDEPGPLTAEELARAGMSGDDDIPF